MPLDTFETALESERYVDWGNGHGFQPVTIRINGIELVELIRRVELPFVEADDRASIAGDYHYLPPKLTFLPSQYFLGVGDLSELINIINPPPHKRPILRCTCGEFECASVHARITLDGDRVTWSDFESHRRKKWHYPLGPFVFDRPSYEAQLAPK